MTPWVHDSLSGYIASSCMPNDQIKLKVLYLAYSSVSMESACTAEVYKETRRLEVRVH